MNKHFMLHYVKRYHYSDCRLMETQYSILEFTLSSETSLLRGTFLQEWLPLALRIGQRKFVS